MGGEDGVPAPEPPRQGRPGPRPDLGSVQLCRLGRQVWGNLLNGHPGKPGISGAALGVGPHPHPRHSRLPHRVKRTRFIPGLAEVGSPGSNSHPTESGETSCRLGTGAAPGALRPHPWRGGGRGAQGWKVRQRWGLLEPAGRPSEDSLPSPGAKVHTGWRPREPLWVQVQLGHPCWWTWSRKSHCPEPVSSVPKGRDFVPLSQMMQVNWGEAPKGPAEGLEG